MLKENTDYLQSKWSGIRNLAQNEVVKRHLLKKSHIPYYDSNVAWPSTVFATPTENLLAIIIALNESSGDLITGDKQSEPKYNKKTTLALKNLC